MVGNVEAKFKINLRLFSALGQNLRSPFLVLDLKGRILFSNETADKLFQFLEKNKIIFSYFDEKSAEKFYELFNEHLSTGEIQRRDALGHVQRNYFILAVAVKLDDRNIIPAHRAGKAVNHDGGNAIIARSRTGLPGLVRRTPDAL
ncbi:MAG: PAS domain-containing protein [Bacteroidetes bacterium]|nr:PAS domain-containing protein [Bacteroidota bacterium]